MKSYHENYLLFFSCSRVQISQNELSKNIIIIFLAQWAIPYSNPRVFAWSLRSYLKGIRIEVSKADGQYRALTEGDIHTVCFFDCAFSVFISRDLSTITTLGFVGVRIV